MTKLSLYLAFFVILSACSSAYERETGEIKTFQIVKDAFVQNSSPKPFIDSRSLLSREQVDAADIPILYVELETGQNGTLTLYPGVGLGQTWLGADGATITFEQGVLKASRGMGDDVMGGVSSKPPWPNLQAPKNYKRKLSFLKGTNKTFSRNFDCKIQKIGGNETLEIWDVAFITEKYIENCTDEEVFIENFYFVDSSKTVRKSIQYHSEKMGYILTERLDR